MRTETEIRRNNNHPQHTCPLYELCEWHYQRILAPNQTNNIYLTKKESYLIWATDNNGQVSRNLENDDKITGKWTTANETDKWNGKKYAKHCQNNNLFVENTFFCPKMEKKIHHLDKRQWNKQQTNWLHRSLKWTKELGNRRTNKRRRQPQHHTPEQNPKDWYQVRHNAEEK